jgi:hypothetical protein
VVSAASEAEGKRSLEPRSSRSAWAKLETLRKKEKEGKRKEKRREGKRKEGRREEGREKGKKGGKKEVLYVRSRGIGTCSSAFLPPYVAVWKFFFFSVLGSELRAFTLSHFTSPIFCDRVF